MEEMKKKVLPILRNIEKELSMDENSIEFVTIIKGGFSTSNILVKTEEKKYLLRYYPGKEEKYSEREFEIMKCVEESRCTQFTPKAYICDSSKSVDESEYCLFEFIPGKPQNQMYLTGKRDLVLELGKILRIIHDSLPKLGEREFKFIKEAPEVDYTLMGQWDEKIIRKLLEPSELVQKMMNQHGGFEDFKKSASELYEKAVEVTKSTIESDVFKNASRKTLIHNDYHVNNMLFEEVKKEGEEGVKIIPRVIDWEHARFGSIYEDIAMFNCTSGQDGKVFLEGYFGTEDYASQIDQAVYDLMFLRKKFFLFSFLLFLVNEQSAMMMCGYIAGIYKEICGLLKKYE